MGGCLSHHSAPEKPTPTALVISVHGDLREHAVPVTANQVLQMEATATANCFLCNSDRLYYDDYIPALDPQDELQAAQIYFLLPTSRLQYKLSASDMAALAVKASVALQKNSSNKGSGGSAHRWRLQKNNKARISPALNDQRLITGPSNYDSVAHKPHPATAPPGFSRSGSISVSRKLQRYSSRRARMAVRSFRLSLTTIFEGSVLQIF